jgi:hypothetical protein
MTRKIVSRRVRWVGHMACMIEQEKCLQHCSWKPAGKRKFGRHQHQYEDNIKVDLQLTIRVLTGVIWFRVVPRVRLL